VDQSLVMPDGQTPGRFRMLETIHEYAAERMRESGEEEGVRRRHAAFFLSRHEEVFRTAESPEVASWYAWCDVELENLRAALRTLEEQGDLADAVRLTTHLAFYWRLRGHAREAWEHLKRLLRCVDEHPRRVINAAGMLATETGDLDAARALFERGLALSEREGRPTARAGSLNHLAIVMQRQGDLAGASRLLEEALTIARGAADPMMLAMTLHNFGNVAYQRHDLGAARAAQQEALVLHRSRGDREGTAGALGNLAQTLAEEGCLAEARALLREALTIQVAIKARSQHAKSFEVLAGLDGATDPGRALRLAGAAASLRRSTGEPLVARAAADLERRLAPARAALSAEEQDRAWREGEAMSEDDAIALALG
jgi:tetratricopeptide (TPR) repeat protein